jgi:hypothetical protein
LRCHQVRNVIVNLGTDKKDVIFQQARVDVIGTLTS